MGRQLPRYPVYVISKGRHETGSTAKMLIRDRVPFRLVVEPQEVEAYAAHFDPELLVTLPFGNLGLGSIPARNWCWENARSEGHDRHWILDDNIRNVYRFWQRTRMHCAAGPALRVVEDFTDRYENIAISGLNYDMNLGAGVHGASTPPFLLNVHVYSCLLIRNDLPFRWRGRYNEDTDLCLQALSQGWCTVLVNAFVVDKTPTMKMKGGNSDELYQGDGRLKMARSLERLWPYVVDTRRRHGRPQHVVRNGWKGFDTPLIRRADIDWDQLQTGGPNEYDLTLTQTGPVHSSSLQAIKADYDQRKGVKGG